MLDEFLPATRPFATLWVSHSGVAHSLAAVLQLQGSVNEAAFGCAGLSMTDFAESGLLLNLPVE